MLNVKMNLNNDKRGVELYFDGIPNKETRDQLKSNGFKWSKFNKCWYAKQSQNTLSLAKKLASEEVKIDTCKATKTTKKVDILPLFDRVIYTPNEKKEKVTNFRYEGSNYNGRMDTKEIAKEVRSHLRKRFKECKFSVTIEGFSGGSSIDVVLKESPYNYTKLDYNLVYWEREEQDKKNNKIINDIISYARSYLQSYNYDDSDSQIDYFNTNFYGDVKLSYDYKQTEQTEQIKKDIEDFETRTKQAQEEEERQQEIEYQKREEERKLQEEHNKILREQEKREEEEIKKNVKVVKLEESKQYIIENVQFANCNKNSSIFEYEEEIDKEEFYLEKVHVKNELHFNESTYDLFKHNLLTDFEFLKNLDSGHYTNDFRINTMSDFDRMTKEERATVEWISNGIAVYCDDELKFIVNTEGYSYSRYAGIPQYNFTKNYNINNKEELTEEQKEAKQQAEHIEDISFNILAENLYLKELFSNSYNNTNTEHEKEYKKLLLEKLKEKNISLNMEIIQQIESNNFKNLLYKFLTVTDSVTEQFKAVEKDLKEGELLTIINNGAFGVSTDLVYYDSVTYTPYAQYTDNVNIIYKKPRKRKMFQRALHGDGIMILKGNITIPKELFYDTKIENGFTITSTKLGSFDKNYWKIIINYLKENNLTDKILVNTVEPIL